jgi:hypothetical protein
MVRQIFIYYEGDRSLRPGFYEFFRELRTRAQEKRCEFHLVYGKSSPDKDFRIGIENHPGAWNILLKDSEGPLAGKKSGLEHSGADSIFWMVEMMEAWFHADKATLKQFYSKGFNEGAMKANPDVEQIAKKDLITGLRAVTKKTGKGDYFEHKTTHGPRLLEAIHPELVKKAAPNCRKLFESILARLG